MKDEDIIGKEFVCFEFPDEIQLKCHTKYKERVGLTAIVQNLHSHYPKYANCLVKYTNDTTQCWHYPTALIKQQIEQAIEDENPVDLDAILLQIKNLTP